MRLFLLLLAFEIAHITVFSAFSVAYLVVAALNPCMGSLFCLSAGRVAAKSGDCYGFSPSALCGQ